MQTIGCGYIDKHKLYFYTVIHNPQVKVTIIIYQYLLCPWLSPNLPRYNCDKTNHPTLRGSSPIYLIVDRYQTGSFKKWLPSVSASTGVLNDSGGTKTLVFVLAIVSFQVDTNHICYRQSEFASTSHLMPDDSLVSTFVNNRQIVSSVKWQYLGTEDGMAFVYPSSKASDCHKYDPRFRYISI